MGSSEAHGETKQAIASPDGAGTSPAPRSRPRIESLSDMVFGLALSLGAITLVASPPSNATVLYTDLASFGFGFLILIGAWLAYTRLMAALVQTGHTALHLNSLLLFFVSIEPFLLNVLLRADARGSFFAVVSQAYAVDVGAMIGLLGLFAWALTTSPQGSQPPQLREQYAVEARNRWIASGLFFVSAIPFFGVETVAGEPLRIWLWVVAVAIGWFARLRVGVPRAPSRGG